MNRINKLISICLLFVFCLAACTSSTQDGIYQKAMKKIDQGKVEEGIELLTQIPDYEDAELYIVGYNEVKNYLGKWEADFSKESSLGNTIFPVSVTLNFSDDNFRIEELNEWGAGTNKAMFTVELEYSLMNGASLENQHTTVDAWLPIRPGLDVSDGRAVFTDYDYKIYANFINYRKEAVCQFNPFADTSKNIPNGIPSDTIDGEHSSFTLIKVS